MWHQCQYNVFKHRVCHQWLNQQSHHEVDGRLKRNQRPRGNKNGYHDSASSSHHYYLGHLFYHIRCMHTTYSEYLPQITISRMKRVILWNITQQKARTLLMIISLSWRIWWQKIWGYNVPLPQNILFPARNYESGGGHQLNPPGHYFGTYGKGMAVGVGALISTEDHGDLPSYHTLWNTSIANQDHKVYDLKYSAHGGPTNRRNNLK